MSGVPARLAPLLSQWDVALEVVTDRVQDLTDDEYFWKPAPGAVTVARLPSGKWGPTEAMDGPTVRTIAWLCGHLGLGGLERWDYLAGSASLIPEEVEWPSTAAEGIGFMKDGLGRWRSALEEMTDEDLDTIGRSSFPWGRDPTLPLLDIVWWVNRELIHHGAEITFLRDLYAQRSSRTSEQSAR